MKLTFCWETKTVKDKFYYNEKAFIKERRNLAICGRHFLHKFSDLACGTPMDGISITEAPGYLFVQFLKPREKKFYIIEINDIEKEIKSGSKSLNEKRANEIAFKIGILK